MARIDAYAYYLSTYSNIRPTRYDSHKKSDLRKVYNHIVKTNKEYLIYRANKIADYERENKKYDDYEIDVAFLGDSLTDKYDVKLYYPQYRVVNRGISGDTTAGIEDRLQVSLYDLKPKIAVMFIGANNMETMFNNYENILKGFQENAPETKIILLSLTSMSGEWGKKNQLAAYNNVKIKMLAKKYSFKEV